MKIGQHEVGPGKRTLVIAEIGVNHDGSVARALELVDEARLAGADAVKLQVFRATQLVNGQGILAAYQTRTTDAESSVELLKRYELQEDELSQVLRYARSLGLATIATPFSLGDVPVCQKLGLDAIKIASPDLVNVPLLLGAAETGLPMLVSTGAATLEEVDDARRVLATVGAEHLFMHCVSSYPTEDADAHLCFIPELVRHYGPLVGYSDHANSLMAGALAVAAGAVVLERHLTYDRTAAGPDHAASSEPDDLAYYIKMVREAEMLRGRGNKRVLPAEEDVRRVSRQSLVLTRDITPEEPITAEHLTTQRPAIGIPASAFRRTLGRRPARNLKAGTLLTWDMLVA